MAEGVDEKVMKSIELFGKHVISYFSRN